ncbi:large conductance mechanosensitive channel protein MscL [Sphingomonas sp. KRR8]|uniref:large conductance mechanosensitive channel protein MscL n=1 Tax=Sphingomonas sp. KRR8 TaxID=2942996 RepID=UPI002020DBE7|nr:large conductance mechanosensitive channel protein MscL [Sphingomonas sp. KRR8]URD59666.1 large conductance mechanosensitive channel protein MscL [Sphingomonas sp. KRR8]
MLREFKAFIARGNVLDLAVAVIIGAAFAAIVSSLTDDVIMPVIGQLAGGLDFSSYFVRLGEVPANYAGSLTDYAALKKAGVPLLGYGAFLTALIKFVILAFIIFLLVKAANRAMGKRLDAEEATAEEILLLREIRDSLRR